MSEQGLYQHVKATRRSSVDGCRCGIELEESIGSAKNIGRRALDNALVAFDHGDNTYYVLPKHWYR